MFDIGWAELILIAVVAIVVVGPKDLPRLMSTIGRYVGRARAMAAEFQRNFEDMARETELEELKREIDRAGEGDILSSPPPIRKDEPDETPAIEDDTKPSSASGVGR